MKNLLLLAVFLLCCISLHAEEYQSLTFTNIDGSEITFPAIGTKITFNNGIITVVNGQETQTISLANVSSMHFTNASAIRKVLSSDYAVNVSDHHLSVTSPKGTDITVTNALGMTVCHSISTNDGEQTVGGYLPSGVYIVKTGEQTLKVLVR